MTFSFQKERMTAIDSDGTPMGYITFPQIRKDLVNVNLVVTYPQFRGQGVAEHMMEALMRHLDKRGTKAALSSSFAQHHVEQNSKWKHLLPENIHFTSY